jgi:hypothetical protein
MPKDIGQELDSIFAHHNGRVGQARSEAVGKSAAEEEFSEAASVCLTNVIAPALQQMAQALNERGVAARVLSDGSEVRIDIPVSRHVRLGQGFGGYPYWRARPERQTRRICIEQNAAGSQGSSRVGDYAIAEISADLVKDKVMALVREIYEPF